MFLPAAALATAMLPNAGLAASGQAAVSHHDSPERVRVMDRLVRDLCDRRIVLLGEAQHGEAGTTSFNVELTRRLVTQCGFDAVLFESSHYDFAELVRRLDQAEPVSTAMLSSSIGGLWSGTREFAPLVPFLLGEARARRVRLGGIDDQLGSAGAFFSLREMPARLASFLPDARAEQCRGRLVRRIYQNYASDAPYDVAEQGEIARCLGEIAASLQRRPGLDRSGRATLLQMVSNFRRTIGRDFLPDQAQAAGRAASMYQNFEALMAQLPANSRVVVWGAGVHMTKDPASTGRFGAAPNFGTLVHRRYGRRVFALGFSAAGGVYRVGRGPESTIAPAGAQSLEAQALGRAEDSIAYADARRLAAIGLREGGAYGFRPVNANWGRGFDGLVVLRTARAPIQE